MKKSIVVAVSLCVLSVCLVGFASPQGEVAQLVTGTTSAQRTREVLVSNVTPTETCRAATTSGALSSRRSCEVFNNGPNTIWCALNRSADAVVNTSRPIAPGGTWTVDALPWMPVYCLSATAAQLTGAATIVSEME